MSEERVISSEIIFEKAKDYKRFYLTGAIINVNVHGEFQIELYEDVNMPADKVIFYEDDQLDTYPNHNRYSRTIHAGMMVPLHQVESLLNELQRQYDNYLAYSKNTHGE